MTAALAFFIYLSPSFENEIKPLLEVLQVKETLLIKLDGDLQIQNGDVRKLIGEVAEKLCG